MNGRKTPIARMIFAAQGAELDDTAWHSRKDSLMNQLKIQLPALRQLKSSFVVTTTEVADNQIHLVVYLEESSQIELRNLSRAEADRDIYVQDWQRVRAQQASLHERFQQAIKSIEHPTESLELQDLRGLLWQSRKDGRIQLHSGLPGAWLPIANLQTTMSQSAKTSIVVKVLRINRQEAGVEICAPLICPFTHRQLFGVHKKLSLARHPKLRDAESSVRLAEMMHEHSGQVVHIEIEYSWVDGSPHKLTLLATHAT